MSNNNYNPLIPPFYNANGFVWVMDGHHKGQLISVAEARMHYLSQAAQYGAGAVFEGCASNANGVIFREGDHTKRFFDSLKTVRANLPEGLTEQVLKDAQYEVLDANAKLIGGKAMYLRPWAGLDGSTSGIMPGKQAATVFVGAWEWPSYFGKTGGLKLDVARWCKNDPGSVPVHAKASGLYVGNGLAKSEAQAAGYDDALMPFLGKRSLFNWAGNPEYIAECTGANFFGVTKDGTVITPPIRDSRGRGTMLPGITRETVINQIMPHLGIPCVVRPVSIKELSSLQAAFVAGTAANVTAIGRIRDHVLDAENPVVLDIQKTYREHFNAQSSRDEYQPLYRPPSADRRELMAMGAAGATVGAHGPAWVIGHP